jgi:hypothetical protein
MKNDIEPVDTSEVIFTISAAIGFIFGWFFVGPWIFG